MSTSAGLQEPWEARERPPSKPLDEAVWQAWVEKGRARESRNSAAGFTVVTCVSLAGLLVLAGLWSHLAPYDVIFRFVVAVSAIFLMVHTFHTGHYAFAPVFGVVALLYNPVAPVLSFSGDWPRAMVLASTIPFFASLTKHNLRREHNV